MMDSKAIKFFITNIQRDPNNLGRFRTLRKASGQHHKMVAMGSNCTRLGKGGLGNIRKNSDEHHADLDNAEC